MRNLINLLLKGGGKNDLLLIGHRLSDRNFIDRLRELEIFSKVIWCPNFRSKDSKNPVYLNLLNLIVNVLKFDRETYVRDGILKFIRKNFCEPKFYDEIYFSGSNDVIDAIRSFNLEKHFLFHCVDEGVGCYFGNRGISEKNDETFEVQHLYSPDLFKLMNPLYKGLVLPLAKISNKRDSLCSWLKKIFCIEDLNKNLSDVIYIDQSFLWNDKTFRKEVANRINALSRLNNANFSVKLHPAASGRDRELFSSINVIDPKGVNVPFELEVLFGVMSPKVVCSIASSASIYHLNMIDSDDNVESLLLYPLYTKFSDKPNLGEEMNIIFDYFQFRYPNICKKIDSWESLEEEVLKSISLKF